MADVLNKLTPPKSRKSILIIDTPKDCSECPFGTICFGIHVCYLDEGNMQECPLRPLEETEK